MDTACQHFVRVWEAASGDLVPAPGELHPRKIISIHLTLDLQPNNVQAIEQYCNISNLAGYDKVGDCWDCRHCVMTIIILASLVKC